MNNYLEISEMDIYLEIYERISTWKSIKGFLPGNLGIWKKINK